MSDIHVAPCGCELHVRIRELEAERDVLLLIQTKHESAVAALKARAEKAEARVAELEKLRLEWENASESMANALGHWP